MHGRADPCQFAGTPKKNTSFGGLFVQWEAVFFRPGTKPCGQGFEHMQTSLSVLEGRGGGAAYHPTLWNSPSHFLLGNTLKKHKI